MSSSSYKYCVLNAVRFRRQTQQAETMMQMLYDSIRSAQSPHEDKFCSGCLKHSLPTSEIKSKRLYFGFGTYFARTASDAVGLDSVEKNGLKWTNLQNAVTYLNKVCSKYWTTLKEAVTVGSGNQNIDQSDSVSLIQGIDMNPAKPRRKEKPDVPEIPEPGVPEVPLPGFPMPGFPDVAVPIVPELPLPELPEIPVPEKPKDPRKSIPLPGQPVPIFPDIFFPRSPASIVPELTGPEPELVTLYNHLRHNAIDHSMLNPFAQAATWDYYIHQKGHDFGVKPAASKVMLSKYYLIYVLRRNKCKDINDNELIRTGKN